MKTISKFELIYKLKAFQTQLSQLSSNKEYSRAKIDLTLFKNELNWTFSPEDFGGKEFIDNLSDLIQNRISKLTQELFAFPCNKDFDSLERTEDTYVRFCGDCQKNVYLTGDEKEIERRRNMGNCISYKPKDPQNLKLYGTFHTTGIPAVNKNEVE